MHNYVIQYGYYYNPLYVSSNSVIIIRRSNCINTACYSNSHVIIILTVTVTPHVTVTVTLSS